MFRQLKQLRFPNVRIRTIRVDLLEPQENTFHRLTLGVDSPNTIKRTALR